MPWCPYTDRELEDSETSPEHVLPLALGGHDAFTIPVCKKFNTVVGSKIDGTLANDPLVLMRRDALGMQGHSRKHPEFTAKMGEHVPSGRPLQITLGRRAGLKLWSPETKSSVEWPGPVRLNFKLDVDAGTRFVAKAGLAAGYLAYGDAFREGVKHDDLRTVMNFRPNEVDPATCGVEAAVHERFSGEAGERLTVIRALCRSMKDGSIVCLVPGSRTLTIAVGILGDYMGSVIVPADTRTFPNEGIYSWGHAFGVRNKTFMRASFRQALARLTGKA